MRCNRIWPGVLAAFLLVSAAGCMRPSPPMMALVQEEQAPASTPTTPNVPSSPVLHEVRPGVPVDGPLTVREVAERVKPAVAQIVTEQGVTLRDLFGISRGLATGIGSGVIFDQAGYILTNYHVVADARAIAVALPDGRTFDARPVGTDPDTDLAVLQIPSGNLPVAPLGDSDRLAVGDGVVAIGNALGLPGGPTVTTGVVSALGRTVQEPASETDEPGPVLYDVIQTDAAINPGNSGGPLVNLAGEVVGINTLIAGTTDSGIRAQGIGFAIAINTAKPIAEQLVTLGRAVHPYLGIVFRWVGGASARQLRSTGQQGVLIERVQPGSPAAQAGLQQGDIITKVDGQPLHDEATLPKEIQKHRPGDTLELTVVRGDTERTVRVTLAERPRR